MRFLFGPVLALIALCSAGCGGSSRTSPQAGTGNASFTIVWPERSRLIPRAANSITITIRRQDGRSLASRTVAWPETSAVFQLPTGDFRAEAAAFPNADGTGTAQAKTQGAAVPLRIEDGKTAIARLILESTIDRLEVTPAGIIGVGLGLTTALTATPRDSEGNVVLVADTLRWRSSNTAVVSVDADGTARGHSEGAVTITVRETESGKEASAQVEAFPVGVLRVVNVSSGSHPAIPPGLKETCLLGPDTLEPSSTCPVLRWNQYTYWAYSYVDNRFGMAIVAYDLNGNIVQRWDKPGARYIWQITIDSNAETVTFWGQASNTIVMTWDELLING